MKASKWALCLLTLFSANLSAQTQVNPYQPGITLEGITYFLPKARLCVAVEATCTKHVPGEYADYAKGYLRLNDVPLTAWDEWKITKITLIPYGTADTRQAYTIKLNPKTSAPFVSLTSDGRLLAINSQAADTVSLPQPSVTPIPTKQIIGNNFKTEAILSAGSKAKMAELAAAEIYDIRENRSLLIKGQAEFMPKDGEQLKLMLASLDEQEEGLLSLFTGTTTMEKHVVVKDVELSGELNRLPLFAFSRYLGFIDADDPAGEAFTLSVADLHSLPAVTETPGAKPKKEKEDLRHLVPGKADITLWKGDDKVQGLTLALPCFGRVEHLGGELFNKRMTTVVLDPLNGGIRQIHADSAQ